MNTLNPEIDLIYKSLTAFGYCGVEDSNVWYPRHCFGETIITFRGCIWSLQNGVTGHGFKDLILAMVQHKLQPFNCSN